MKEQNLSPMYSFFYNNKNDIQFLGEKIYTMFSLVFYSISRHIIMFINEKKATKTKKKRHHCTGKIEKMASDTGKQGVSIGQARKRKEKAAMLGKDLSALKMQHDAVMQDWLKRSVVENGDNMMYVLCQMKHPTALLTDTRFSKAELFSLLALNMTER